MKISHQKIAVVHLVWIPYGITHFKAFVNSLKEHHTGTQYDLIFLFNGVDTDADITEYIEFANKENLIFQYDCLKEGQDIDAYRYIAAKIQHEFILFFNSYSTLMAGNWLDKYYAASNQSSIGIVASSASLQSYYTSVFQKNKWGWEFNQSITYNYRKYKLFLKTFFYWRFLFKPFPNPHVRTNAFMIRRVLFLEIKNEPLTSKFKAYQFESGRNSITNQILKRGLKTLVIDKNGQTYEPTEWKNSNTFWINDQENLLVSDNQTKIYNEASLDKKKQMTKLAWGINE